MLGMYPIIQKGVFRVLRPIQTDDATILYHLFCEEKGGSFLDLPLGSRNTFARWLNEVQAGELLGFCLSRVIMSKQDRVAGLVILSSIDQAARTAEMGTWLGLSYRGIGLNHQAKQEMLEIAFGSLGLDKILLWIADKNIPATKAIKKLPFVTIPEQELYSNEKKHRQFLFSQPFTVYEIHKDLYFLKTKRW